nr:hypothetical protein [Tanacetum cinerariifolium]
NPSNEITTSNSNQKKEGPPQDFDIRQLIREEWCIEVCEEQRQNMENTILELVKICQQKELYCMHNNYPEIHLPSPKTSDEVFQANHSIQNKESFENPSDEIAVSKISEEQKQGMEDTMLELVKICQEKEFLCIHDDVDDLIESALNSKLLLINSNSQRLDKKEQERSLLFSNPLFDNDNLDSSNDESLPDEDVPAEEFKIYSNPLFDENEINSDRLDPHCFNVESDFVESLLNRDTFIDSL